MADYIDKCPALHNQKAIITSPYGTRKDPITGKESFHSGIDLVPAYDNNQVTAICNGIVIDYMNTIKGYDDHYTKGNYVRILHPSGRHSLYLHMAYGTVKDYKLGEVIYKGDTIGLVGATGRATGPHLHFQMYNCTGKAVEPPEAFLRGLSANFVANRDEYIEVLPCRPGDVSADVVKLQRALARLSAAYEAEVMQHSWIDDAWDGTYGEGLKGSVARLQAKAGLKPTGICDGWTAAVLNRMRL